MEALHPRDSAKAWICLSRSAGDISRWPAALQFILKNEAKSSVFELLRDSFSKRFQSNIVCHLNDDG